MRNHIKIILPAVFLQELGGHLATLHLPRQFLRGAHHPHLTSSLHHRVLILQSFTIKSSRAGRSYNTTDFNLVNVNLLIKLRQQLLDFLNNRDFLILDITQFDNWKECKANNVEKSIPSPLQAGMG